MDFSNSNMLLDFLYQNGSPYTSGEAIKKVLHQAGFTPLNEDDAWDLIPGMGYFLEKEGTSVTAFRYGSGNRENMAFVMGASHIDIPGLVVKQGPAEYKDGCYWVPVELYGAPIVSTWLDTPLTLCGQVVLSTEEGIDVQNFFIEEPVGVIPNAAIHLNREINKGFEYDFQSHLCCMVPEGADGNKNNNSVEGFGTENRDIIKEIIADGVKAKVENILSYEAFFTPTAKPVVINPAGSVSKTLVLSQGIDNSVSSYALLEGIISSQPKEYTQVAFFFNHEEIGSATGSGAYSSYPRNILKRIGGFEKEESFARALARSFAVSCDGAQGMHQGYSEKYDQPRAPILGEGVAVKHSSKRNYSTNPVSSAILRKIVPEYTFQNQYNHSNQPGGRSLGPLLESVLSCKVVDIGIPMLSMHSICETAHLEDIQDLGQVLTRVFSGYRILK